MPSYPETTALQLERSPGWMTVWLARPEMRNAISGEMLEELLAVCEAARSDADLRGLTLRGRGGVFSAGGDIKGFAALLSDGAGREQVRALSRRAGELFHAINELPQVVIAFVEGTAMAGGIGLMAAADIAVATPDAKFAFTEPLIGLTPAQIAPLVAARIGNSAARRLMLTAARFDANEAQRIGLADVLVANEEDFSRLETDLRGNVLACAPGANAATKAILRATGKLERDAMIDFAAYRFAECFTSLEGREGIAAFMEKRKPGWSMP